MSRLIKFCLVIIALYLAFQSFIALFFYNSIPIPLQATEFTLEQISEYRARVIIPAFFLTLLYFIYRFFLGKNPTSAVWPIYVAIIAFLLAQIIAFITFLPFSTDAVIMLIITVFMLFVVRGAHNQRKKEIF